MSTNRRPTIAVLIGDTQSTYSTELISGFYSCAMEENVNLLFLMRPTIPNQASTAVSDMVGITYDTQFSTIFDYVNIANPDALIISYGSLTVYEDSPSKEELIRHFRGIPTLMFEDTCSDPNVPYLITDNYDGMKSCVEHLVRDHGCRRVAFVCGPKGNHDSNERLRAYRDVMAANNLPVTDSMVAYGNYSENIDSLLEEILDANPKLDALVFANDNMAKAGYRVCAARGLAVGKDIAITGFDDEDLAKTMTPPLTSVSHNSFMFSYQALQNALMLCQGQNPLFYKLPAILHRRGSCGCVAKPRTLYGTISSEALSSHINERVDTVVEELFSSIPYEKIKERFGMVMKNFFNYIFEELFLKGTYNFSYNVLMRYLDDLQTTKQISHRLLLDNIVDILEELTTYTSDFRIRRELEKIICETQRIIFSGDIMTLEQKSFIQNHRAWFLSTFTKDLSISNRDGRDNLLVIMERLRNMKIKSSYFFLYKDPVQRSEDHPIQPAKNLFLTGYFNQDELLAYTEDDWIPVDTRDGICAHLQQDGAHFYTTYILFSGDEQYGIMVCECDHQEIPFLLVCSMEIGNLFRMLRLSAAEQAAKQELHKSLKLIREQNSILSFISEYDELSKLLNRRGFVEKTLRAISDHDGKQAFLMFADIDHLKQINDMFGHASGDFAITTCAAYLRDCLPEDAIIARFGGDEFVAFFFNEKISYRDELMEVFRAHIRRFNDSCDKPFYVEMSAGVCTFTCSSRTDLSDLLQRSDTILYEEKRKRRANIQKIES